MLLKKSFLADERNFSAPLVRPRAGPRSDIRPDFLSPGRALALHHGLVSQGRHILTMPPVVFRCPATLMNVQHSLDDDPDVPENEYEVITCLACTKLHLINRKTGKILGQDGPRK
jgi:hypothetical protein